MIGAPNSLNLNWKVHAMKEAPGPSVSEEIADVFTNYNIDIYIYIYIYGTYMVNKFYLYIPYIYGICCLHST